MKINKKIRKKRLANKFLKRSLRIGTDKLSVKKCTNKKKGTNTKGVRTSPIFKNYLDFVYYIQVAIKQHFNDQNILKRM